MRMKKDWGEGTRGNPRVGGIHLRIDTLVERSGNIKEKIKVERKISFHSFQNKFEQRITKHHNSNILI